MKILTIILVIISTIALCMTYEVSSTTFFLLSPYQDSKCTLSSTKATTTGWVGFQKCWGFTSAASIKATAWTPTTSTLTFDFFTGNGDCSGNVAVSQGTMKCDGTCYPDDFKFDSYSTCIYVDFPTPPFTGKFEFSTFSDSQCKNQTENTGYFTGSNQCWITSSNTSIYPLEWTSSSLNLNAFIFGANGKCGGNRSGETGVSSIICNGSCLDNGLGKYYSCEYSSSNKFILPNLIVLFVFLLIFM